MVLTGEFVIPLFGACGMGFVCLFPEPTEMNQLGAASYGAQQKGSMRMEDAVVKFGKEEKKGLAEGIEQKKMTVSQEETFHPGTCRGAIESVSHFILVETYSSGKKAQEWTFSMNMAIRQLPIEGAESSRDDFCIHRVMESNHNLWKYIHVPTNPQAL
jgi:hypothetical protein